MTFAVIPFKPEHIAQINLQEQQRGAISHLEGSDYADVLRSGSAISVVSDDRMLASGGVFVRMGIGTVWALFATDAGAHFLALHHAALRIIEAQRLRRIEATTETHFAQGSRWLELLGFRREGTMRKYGPAGEDHYLYARTT